jgi:Amt family ammonium transporter
MAMLVTQIATATAGLSWMFAEWGFGKKPSLLGILSGAIAGLVAITPAAGFVGPVGAFFIGLIAGIACYWASTKLKNKFGYDDSLDVFGIHGVGGTVGALLTGIFAKEAVGGAAGLLEGNIGQLWTQFIGVCFTIIYTGVLTYIILKVVGLITPLIATSEVETQGLDLNQHGEQVS